MNTSIAIMAAGFGTRMKSKTPKVLHTLCGFPMLYHIIKEAQKISDDIHVILYHEAEKIQETMNKYFEGLQYVIQDHDNYPGTGGAIRGVNCKYSRLLVLNGDMPLLKADDMNKIIKTEGQVIISNFLTDKPFGYGRVIIDASGHVTKVVEEKDASDEEKNIGSVNAGVYLFEQSFLAENLKKLSNNNQQKEYYITDLIGIAAAQNIPIKTVRIDETNFMGVNSKVHLAQAQTHMQNRIKEDLMNAGVIMRLPESIYIESDVEIEGECIIENGVSILNGSKLKNSHIKSNTVIENSTVENSSVGPMARIRPGSHIYDSQIGNFVEIKKSTLKGVKAGHLSYLGDASVDVGTNIGCGTITCNYDGKQKHKTIIGKNVFVGSDSQFVAPVVIQDDVIIASGTTITKDVPKGALAINRAALKLVPNFFYKFFPQKRDK